MGGESSAIELLRKLGASEEAAKLFHDGWDEAMRLLPGSTPQFLQREETLSNAKFCGIEEKYFGDIVEAAQKIANDPDMLRLAWYIHWKMYLAPARFGWDQGRAIPSLDEHLGRLSGVFCLLLGLAQIPSLKAYHRSLGIPEDVTKATSMEVRSFLDNHLRAYGRTGLFKSQLPWLQSYLHGNLMLRLGRFEFWAKRYGKHEAKVYRRRKDGKVLALASSGALFNERGFMDSPKAMASSGELYWKSSLEESNGKVSGNPVSPKGMALRRKVELSLSEWDCVLDSESTVLDMHIPAGGSMGLDICRDSFMLASDFFTKHFPCLSPKAITCTSWIFSPNLPEFLPEDSNLVKFMRECHLHPVESSKRDGLWFVFFKDEFEPGKMPSDSSLQRALSAHLEKGGELRHSGMLFLLDDVPKFGSRPYLSNMPEQLS